MTPEEPTTLHRLPTPAEWERANNAITGLLFERECAGAFLGKAEALLKDAGAYIEPRPGDVRYDAILAGMQHLVAENRRWKRLNMAALSLAAFIGIAFNHLVAVFAHWLGGAP
jgi:hypothetical protein